MSDVEWRQRDGQGPWSEWETCYDVADEVLAALTGPDQPEYVQTYHGTMHYQWRLRPPGDLVGVGAPTGGGPVLAAAI